MIKREFYKTRKDGVNLYRTYSDANMVIRQLPTGNLYAEAIDVENAPYDYIETNIPNSKDSSGDTGTDRGYFYVDNDSLA